MALNELQHIAGIFIVLLLNIFQVQYLLFLETCLTADYFLLHSKALHDCRDYLTIRKRLVVSAGGLSANVFYLPYAFLEKHRGV